MKLSGTPKFYMPLPQNQSDDDESGPSKEDKIDKPVFKSSFDASEVLSKKKKGNVGSKEVNKKYAPMSPLRCTIACHPSYKWRKAFPNISFTSPLDFVDHKSFESRLVILGFEGIESGLMAIKESDGKESWRLHLHSLPASSICNVIDVNSDGIKECLVIGNDGLLVAIDVKKGISLWYMHNHSNLNNANTIYGPIIVPDSDQDGIEDIVVSYNIGSGENNSYLALVSGGTGQIIGSLIELPQCIGPAVTHLSVKIHNETHLVLHCQGENNDNLWLLSSKHIHEAVLNETDKLLLQNVFRVPYYSKEIQLYQVSGSKGQLVMVLDTIKVMLLEMTFQFKFQILWETHFKDVQHLSILIDGQFMSGSNQLVITYSQKYQSKVIGLNLIDGQEIWSITHDNGTVTSAIKLPKYFGNIDGLLLKILSSVNVHKSENSKNNSSDQNSEKKAFQESYILVKCGEVPVGKTISTEEVLTVCKADGGCDPNVYTTKSTALAKAATLGSSIDVLTVTSAALPASSTEVMIINFDGQFTMAWILKQGMTPDVIPNGGLIMSTLHPSLKIRIIDSLNFLPMPLSKM
ncbi:uncharacterized protein CDAR_24631 [Caerostris darwini]|uniref:FAM234A/B beta-propeller domain-containing protein n=1 Tax=Caerostris darwini TaxID=1538125 RepID=A0AAV4QF97_9ARAC|nr:uncharacterized protein CDAR_24631 [Caerostris darwini]